MFDDPLDRPVSYPIRLRVWSHEERDVTQEDLDEREPMAVPAGLPLRELVRGYEDHADRVEMAVDAEGALMFHRDLPGLPHTGDAALVVEALLEAAGDRLCAHDRVRAAALLNGLRNPTVAPLR